MNDLCESYIANHRKSYGCTYDENDPVEATESGAGLVCWCRACQMLESAWYTEVDSILNAIKGYEKKSRRDLVNHLAKLARSRTPLYKEVWTIAIDLLENSSEYDYKQFIKTKMKR